LYREHDLTQAEIGIRLGVSQMQVSRIIRGAIEQLSAVANAAAAAAARRPLTPPQPDGPSLGGCPYAGWANHFGQSRGKESLEESWLGQAGPGGVHHWGGRASVGWV